MTIAAVLPRDRRWWIVASLISMGGIATFDRFGGERFRAPVGAVIVGPLIAAIACGPVMVAGVVAVAAIVRFVLDVTDPSTSSSQIGFNTTMVLLLGAIAVIASLVRSRRERELAAARPAHRLASLSASLAAAESVHEVVAAFDTLAAELDSATACLSLGESAGPAEDPPSSYSALLHVGSGSIGRVDVWFHAPPDADTRAVLDQAVAQISVALSRVQSRQALAVTARRLNALQRCTSQLAGLLRTDDIADAMVSEAHAALECRNAALYVVDGDIARLVAISGAGGLEPPGTNGLRETTALADALRNNDVSIDSADAGPGALTVVAPIVGRQGVAAALQLWFDDAAALDEGDRLLVRSLATLISSAWRRAELFEQEERERAGSTHRAERAARLATLVATLADARDRAAVAAAVTDHGLDAVDASFGAIFELDAGQRALRLVSGRMSGPVWTTGMTIRLDRPMALTTAVREARTVTMATYAEIVAQHPDEEVHPREEARAAVPLVSYGQVVGALGFAWHEPHVFDAGEIAYLETVATRVAEALERGRLYEAEREDERRWNLLAEASARLADAIEPGEVLRALVRWAVPLLADSCSVYLAQPDGTARPFVSVDLADHPDAEEIFERERIDLASDHPIARLYQLRRTLLLEDLESDTVDAAVGDDAARVDRIRALGVRHAIGAPLSARNQQLGVLVLTMGRSGRAFTANDVELVADLASRFSIVYDNAVLFATERTIGARLQAALLPASLEPPPMLDVAVRYEASGSRAGGDWYDLISFGDAGAALVVGDLVGHGVEAAATMSRYRSALRAHGRMFEDPDDVMNAFSSFIHTDEAGQTATVLYSRIRPAFGTGATLTYCSAGHPPPIVLHGGAPVVLPSPQGPLIGLVRGGYIAHAVDLPVGAVVLLYTDGLLERRGETLDDGLRRLVEVVAALPTDDLEQFVDDLLVAMADVHDDDIAVIAARVTGHCKKLT